MNKRIQCVWLILEDIIGVGVAVMLVDAESVEYQRNKGARSHCDEAGYQAYRAEHTVDPLAGHILLIISDIGIDCGGKDVGKRAHKGVHPQADKHEPYRPDADGREHKSDKENIKQISDHQHCFLAPAAYRKRRRKHTPERGVAVDNRYQRILAVRAQLAVVVEPAEYVGLGILKEAYPARKGDYPEVFVLCDGLYSLKEADLYNVGLGLDYLLLGVGKYHDAQRNTDDRYDGEHDLVNADIIHIACVQQLRHKGKQGVEHGGGERIGYRLDGRNVGSLLGVG